MNTIIHEIVEKIILDMKNNLEDLILDSKDISKFILNTRKKEYYIQRRNDKKT